MAKNRLPLATTLLLCASLLLGATALASTKIVRDDKRETKRLKRNPRMDIVRASAGHGGGRLVHRIVMRRRVDPDRRLERPLLVLNVRGGRRSKPEFLVLGSAVYRNPAKGDPIRIAPADLSARKRRWTYRFDPDEVGKNGLGNRYGWAVISEKRKIFDIAPNGRYKWHPL